MYPKVSFQPLQRQTHQLICNITEQYHALAHLNTIGSMSTNHPSNNSLPLHFEQVKRLLVHGHPFDLKLTQLVITATAQIGQ